MDHPLQTQQDSIRLELYQEPETSLPGGSFGGYLGQAYINCFPIVAKNTITGETQTIIVKRQGTVAPTNAGGGNDFSPLISSYGTSDRMVPICNMVVTQLYDVYVGAWFDGNNSKIYILQYRPISGTTTKIGEITGCNVNDIVFITEITNGDTLLPGIAVSYQKSDKSSGTGYYAVSTAGVMTSTSLTMISSTSFPANILTPRIITGPFQYMNGHIYIMTLDGYIYMSSLTVAGNPDITTWNTLATVTATQEPDGGIGVFRYKHHLLAIGKDSIEFFNDAGDPPPGSTLERTDQAFVKFGALSPRLIQNFDDTIYWIAYGSNNSFGLWQMVGYVPTKISDLKIDSILLQGFSGLTDVYYRNMQCVVLGGRKHLLLNGFTYTTSADFFSGSGSDTYPVISVSNKASTIAYNLDDKVWWGLSMLSSYQAAYPIFATSFNAASQLGNYRQYFFCASQSSSFGGDDASSTRVQYFQLATPAAGSYVDQCPIGTDFGVTVPINIVISLNPYWFDTERRKRINKIKVIADGLTTVDASVYAMYIIATPDNTYDFTGASSLSRRIVIPTTDQRYYDNNWGMMRAINISIVSTTQDDMRIRAVELDLAQGTA